MAIADIWAVSVQEADLAQLNWDSIAQRSAVQRGEEQQALKTHTKNGKAPVVVEDA